MMTIECQVDMVYAQLIVLKLSEMKGGGLMDSQHLEHKEIREIIWYDYRSRTRLSSSFTHLGVKNIQI